MRTVVVLLSLGSLLNGCTREPEAAPGAAPGQAEQAPPAAEQAQFGRPPTALPPRFGGAVVATGEYAVEVVANANGTVEAAVATAAGEIVPSADVAALEVTAQGEGEARHKIALGWDAPRGLFRGVLKGGARLASGPLDVSCSIRGKAHAGHLDMAVALPSPKLGGRMMAVGAYSAEVVPKVGGEVEVHLRDAAGAAIAAGGGLDLKLRAQGKAGAMLAHGLRWDAPHGCFKGRLQAEAELAPGPLELTLRAGAIEAMGRVEAVALLTPPSFGGTVIATGDLTVEVAPQLDGQIDAVVHDAAGAAIQGGVELEARVQAGGELRPVKLTWDPAVLRFRGKLDGNFAIEPGPIELSVLAQGRLRVGSIMAAAVVPAIAVEGKADLEAGLAGRANLNAKAKLAAAARAKAEAAGAAQANAKARVEPVKAAASGSAKLSAKVPQPSLSVKAGAGAKASGSGEARTSGSADGTAAAKQQGGIKLGGSLTGGVKLGAN